MKRFLILSGIIALLFIFPRDARAACYPLNENTGLCDVGSLCSGTSTCCTDPQNECGAVTTPAAAGSGESAAGAPSDTHTTSPYCNGTSGINTALGCISTSETGFFQTFFQLGIGIAGGIAFLLILYGGLKMMLSAGNPEALNEGREVVTSAIFGLLLIIFSVFILKIIGVNVLGLPGFS